MEMETTIKIKITRVFYNSQYIPYTAECNTHKIKSAYRTFWYFI